MSSSQENPSSAPHATGPLNSFSPDRSSDLVVSQPQRPSESLQTDRARTTTIQESADNDAAPDTSQLVSTNNQQFTLNNMNAAANAGESNSASLALRLQEHSSVNQAIPAASASLVTGSDSTQNMMNQQINTSNVTVDTTQLNSNHAQLNLLSRQSSSLTGGGSFSRNMAGLGQAQPPNVQLGSSANFIEEEVKLQVVPQAGANRQTLNPFTQQTFSRQNQQGASAAANAPASNERPEASPSSANNTEANQNNQMEMDFASMIQASNNNTGNNQAPPQPVFGRTVSNQNFAAQPGNLDGLRRTHSMNITDEQQRNRPQRLLSGFGVNQFGGFQRNDNISARSPISVDGQSLRQGPASNNAAGIRPAINDNIMEDDDVGAESAASLRLTFSQNEPLLSPSPNRATRRMGPISSFRFPDQRAQTPRTSQRPTMPRMNIAPGFMNDLPSGFASAGQSPIGSARPHINVPLQNIQVQPIAAPAAAASAVENRSPRIVEQPAINVEIQPAAVQDDILDSPPPEPFVLQPPTFNETVQRPISSLLPSPPQAPRPVRPVLQNPRLNQRRQGLLIPPSTLPGALTGATSGAQTIQRAAERLIRERPNTRRREANTNRLSQDNEFANILRRSATYNAAQASLRRAQSRILPRRELLIPNNNGRDDQTDSENMEVVDDVSSKDEQSDSHTSSYIDSDTSQHFYESEWSEADELMKQDEESFPDLTVILAAQKAQQNKMFHHQVLESFGTIGLIIANRAQGSRFDRRNLFGQGNSSMKRFSSGMSFLEIAKNVLKAINLSFNNGVHLNSHANGSQLSYNSLKMMDDLLPQDSNKMLLLVKQKYRQNPIAEHFVREIAAIKLVFDFRISMYRLYGDQKKILKNLQYAKSLHEMLDRNSVEQVYNCIEPWLQEIKVPDQYQVPVFRCRKTYLSHYRKEIDLVEQKIAEAKKTGCYGSKKYNKMQSNALFTQL